MTKRQKASYHQNASLERERDPDFIPDGAAIAGQLARRPPFHPYLLPGYGTRCYACRQFIEPGHTAFTCWGHPGPGPILCYRCGIAWEIHNGRLTLEQADSIPPFGGPV